MAGNIHYRCPNCGGELAFNAKTQNWNCEYCDHEFDLAALEAAGKAEIDESHIQKEVELDGGEVHESTDGTQGDMVAYTCSHCGGQIITDKTTAATSCIYCGNPVVIAEKLVGEFKPEYVIPFKTTEEEVRDTFRKFIKKPLTPKKFYKDENIERLRGVYIPFWLYNAKGHSNMVATGNIIRTWSDRNYRYTKTDVYRLIRDGQAEFHSIPADGSSKTDNAAMHSIEPFQYQEMQDFSPAYLAGFLAERYDVNPEEARKVAQERIGGSLRGQLLSTTRGFSGVRVEQHNVGMDIHNRSYVLLPVWLLNTEYKGKQYLCAMNGQTGKFTGNLPIDTGKALLFSALGCAGGALASMLLYALFMLGG